MALRVCSSPGCPELVSKAGRCASCSSEHERTRGTRQQRGYDAAHGHLRARWAPKVATGRVDCWRCGQRLNPLEPWDLGHLDDRSGYGGPECIPCNRATASR